MLVCKNCGGYFSAAEMQRIKPPRYPWRLTPAGERFLAENAATGGEQPPCPSCGNKTLRPANVPAAT